MATSNSENDGVINFALSLTKYRTNLVNLLLLDVITSVLPLVVL
jgi:hypothetical protein